MPTYAVQCTSTVTPWRWIASGLRWRSALGCLLALGGALACDDGGDRGPDLGRGDVDGERLVARTLSFPGGASVQVGWYDQELETPCDFGVAADGQLRCIPEAGPANALGYSRADCAASSPLIEILPPCDGGPQTLALIRRLDGCAGQAQVFRLGAPDTSGRFYFLDQEGVCRETTQSEAWTYYEAEEMPPDDMVAGEHTALGPGRLQRYVDAARDGAQRLTAEFRDTELDDDCVFMSAGDGSLRCVPGETSLDEGFTATPDASCVGEAALVPLCLQSSFALRGDPSTCGRTLVYELGDALADGLALYKEIDGECLQVDNELQGAVMRWVGPEVNPAELAGVEVELFGEGRVRGRRARLEDDSTVFIDFWDSQLEATCSSLTLRDDTIVCAPSDMLHIDAYNYFSDPECVETREIAAGSGTCPAEGEIIHVRVPSPSACSESRFHQVGGEVEGDIFFLNRFTYECRALTEAERGTLREIGEEIDPELEAAEPGSAPASATGPHQG